MGDSNPWQIKSSQIVYQNPWIKIHEDKVIMPSGKPGMYAYLESNDSVTVVALNDNAEVYLIRQFAYPAAVWSWRLPQGGGDKQNLLQAAQRELKEETGITARHWQKLGKFRIQNGLMTETCAIYVASDLAFSDKTDEEEAIDGTQWASMSDIDAMIKHGEIDDGQSIVAIHFAQKWLANKGAKA